MKEKKIGLSPAEEKKLIACLNDFGKWLKTKKVLDKTIQFKFVVDMPFANADWVMKVDGNKVSFNTLLTNSCSFEYFRMVILHEFFHLVVQRVPNKEDATKIKDDFGDELLKLIDIEADYFAALYQKEKFKYNIVSYLKLYYEGNSAFSDRWIRNVKFERFIGSILSVFKMFINSKKAISSVPICDLYLPSISAIYTAESLHVLVIRKEHIYFDEINANYKDFVDLKECYTNIDSLTLKEYTRRIVKFASKALKLSIPENIEKEISNIK